MWTIGNFFIEVEKIKTIYQDDINIKLEACLQISYIKYLLEILMQVAKNKCLLQMWVSLLNNLYTDCIWIQGNILEELRLK